MKLSIEVKDLLDKIFVVDSTKRIHLDEIKNHPWYKKALPAEYEKALRILEEEQAKLPPCPIANMDKVRSAVARGWEGWRVAVLGAHCSCRKELAKTFFSVQHPFFVNGRKCQTLSHAILSLSCFALIQSPVHIRAHMGLGFNVNVWVPFV